MLRCRDLVTFTLFVTFVFVHSLKTLVNIERRGSGVGGNFLPLFLSRKEVCAHGVGLQVSIRNLKDWRLYKKNLVLCAQSPLLLGGFCVA